MLAYLSRKLIKRSTSTIENRYKSKWPKVLMLQKSSTLNPNPLQSIEQEG